MDYGARKLTRTNLIFSKVIKPLQDYIVHEMKNGNKLKR
jgi:hypothetical protein